MPELSTSAGLKTLTIDIGGTGLKALVLNEVGEAISTREVVPTPKPALPGPVISAIVGLASRQPQFDRVSVGFPGVVDRGITRTAPNLHPDWNDFPCQRELEQALNRPVRVCNDADVQGFGAIKGEGLEMVITLGTGMGSALFVDGILVPNLELAHHPFAEGKTYEQLLGNVSLQAIGVEPWKRWLTSAIQMMRQTFNFNVLYIGGGNTRLLKQAEMPSDVKLVDNIAGLLGGIALWTDVHGTSLVRAPHSTGAHSVIYMPYGGI